MAVKTQPVAAVSTIIITKANCAAAARQQHSHNAIAQPADLIFFFVVKKCNILKINSNIWG